MHQVDEQTSKCKTIYHGVTLIKNSSTAAIIKSFLATRGVAANYSKTTIAVKIN